MNPEQEFINQYIERLMGEVIELTKIRIMNEAKNHYLENLNKQFLEKITALEEQVAKQSARQTKKKEADASEF